MMSYPAPSRAKRQRAEPPVQQWRALAVADALSLAKRERIHADAVEAAERIMRDWEGRR